MEGIDGEGHGGLGEVIAQGGYGVALVGHQSCREGPQFIVNSCRLVSRDE